MPVPQVTIRPCHPDDHAALLVLWSGTAGVEVSVGDDLSGLHTYLARNPSLSRVAVDSAGRIVGAVLCGHDGRRGFLYHLAVAPTHRHQGIGRRLVRECVDHLRANGLRRVLILVEADNAAGREFWSELGFESLEGVVVMGRDL